MPAKGWSKKKNERGNLVSVMLKLKWANPTHKAERLAKIAATKARTGNYGNRTGVPHGMTRKEAQPLWDQARAQAQRFIKIMEEADKVEKTPLPGSKEDMGKKALEEAYAFAISPLTDAKTKQAYLKLVMDFTLAKPESKTNLTLNNSEKWLNELHEDLQKTDG